MIRQGRISHLHTLSGVDGEELPPLIEAHGKMYEDIHK
jgi:hypothetical protein